MSKSDEIYYRVIAYRNSQGGITETSIVQMQWFDEYSYDQSIFLTEERFKSAEAAQVYIDAEIQKALKWLPYIKGIIENPT